MSDAGQSDVLLALHGGEREPRRWRRFLDALARHCSAEVATLAFVHAECGPEQAALWRSAAADDASLWPASAVVAMRPGRVYALEELAAPPAAPRGDAHDMRFGRLVRVTEPHAWSAWLGVFRRVGDLAAADTARLSALVSHFSVAMANFAQLELVRLRAAIAEDLLARASISAGTLAPNGRVIAATSAQWPWAFADDAVEEPKEAARLAARTSDAPTILRGRRDRDALAIAIASHGLAAPAPPGVTVVVRSPQQRPQAARALEQLWALTPSEARLVIALVCGNSLTDAAARLGLTVETARNYSKRIYAKTGASGQADLVRRALTSVAALA